MTIPSNVRVFLASRPVDMRKSHDGLMAIVRNTWHLDPFSGHLFAFVGKRGDRIKVLYLQRGGMTLIYTRLEKGRFRVPRTSPDTETIELEGSQLAMLLDGIDFQAVQRPAHWTPSASRNHPIPNELMMGHNGVSAGQEANGSRASI